MPVVGQVETRTLGRRRTAATATAVASALLCLLALASVAQAAAPRAFFGVSAVRPTPADFKRMGDLGAGAYRVEISWSQVQPRRGNDNYNWNGTDQRFRRAATFGLRPTPIVFGSPDWASGDSDHIRGPVKTKRQRQGWHKFVAAAVRRYGPDGTFWQGPKVDSRLAPADWIIWNEQNARAFWHPKASPRQYARLLRISRRAIDTFDPSIRMTIGGMYGYPQHKNSMGAKKFLRRLYRQRGAKQLIDGVSVHPYAANMRGVKRQTRALKRVMNRAGDRRAALWIGETGWASGGSKKGGFGFLVKNRKKQAQLLRRAHAFFLSKRRRWNIKRVFWFAFKDYAEDPICSWCPKAGLLNKRDRIKPSGSTYRRLIARRTG